MPDYSWPPMEKRRVLGKPTKRLDGAMKSTGRAKYASDFTQKDLLFGALVIPPLVRVLTWLTPLAAASLVLLMLGAIVFHVQRREYPNVGFNAVLGLLAAVIAWGRFGPYPF